MRKYFLQKEVVDSSFARAMAKLGDRTSEIRAFELRQENIELQREQAAASPNIVEMQRYKGAYSDEQWAEHMDFERFREIALALAQTTSSFRVIPVESNRPFDYEAEETA